MLKSIRPLSVLLFAALALSGCASSPFTASTTAAVKTVVLDPNNEAKAAQVLTAAISNRVLAKNPTYSGDVLALANALTALAQANAAVLTVADIQATVAKTSLSSDLQSEIVSDFSTAQGLLLTDFNVTLPTLKPIYALWLQALANGFYISVGHAAIPLPIIPPTITATVTPTGT